MDATFRITNRFSLSNHHLLSDKTLSLKAKGLLSIILSLPENWNYTMSGLSYITGETREKISTTIKELVMGGYIEHKRIRDEKGRFRGAEYIIYEKPQRETGTAVRAKRGTRKEQYTRISSSLLKDQRLSLKTKGLLLIILSLPEDWRFNIRGLSHFCKDGIFSVRSSVVELENNGYLTRETIYTEDRISGVNYVINGEISEKNERKEVKQNACIIPKQENHTPSVCRKFIKDKKSVSNDKNGFEKQSDEKIPMRENCTTGKPMQENHTLPNIDHINTKILNTSIHHSTMRVTYVSAEDRESATQKVKANIGYDYIATQKNQCFLDTIIEVICDVVNSTKSVYLIRGMSISGDLVKKRFQALNQNHVQYTLERLSEVTTPIKNVYGYVLSMLWNAVPVMDTDYALQVNADVYAYNSFDCTAICV